MEPTRGALVVFGSGPGVGTAVASLFAERGFSKIILISRNATRLAQDAETVRSAQEGAAVLELTCDLGDSEQVDRTLPAISVALGETSLECVLYNAARLGKSEFFSFSPEMLERDMRITTISLYAVAQWALPLLLKVAESDAHTPSLLVTSGMIAKDPSPAVFSLGASKAGQYNLVHSLHKAYDSKGVHCGLVVIGGTVSKDSKVTNPRNIAEKTWELFSQPKTKGSLEMYLEDPNFAEHVRNRDNIDRK